MDMHLKNIKLRLPISPQISALAGFNPPLKKSIINTYSYNGLQKNRPSVFFEWGIFILRLWL